MRAVRGAITLRADDAEELRSCTLQLLRELLSRNAIGTADIVSAMFTVTNDIRSGNPASIAREHGWQDVAMICAQEIDVPGALPLCVRILLHVRGISGELAGVYLAGATVLRPDIAERTRS